MVLVGVSLFTAFIFNVFAQEKPIPSWIKNTAKFWVEGQVSDKEFINALQYLVEQNILVIPKKESGTTEQQQKPQPGFSNTVCSRNFSGMAIMTGKFTNGPTPASDIYFRLGVIDSKGNVVATGIGSISDVQPYQTRLFEAMSTYVGEFASCEIEVSNVFR